MRNVWRVLWQYVRFHKSGKCKQMIIRMTKLLNHDAENHTSQTIGLNVWHYVYSGFGAFGRFFRQNTLV